MHGISKGAVSVAGLLVLALVVTACHRKESGASDRETPEYTSAATIKDLMQSIVDPSADDVWLSVTTVMSHSGVVETVPKTDEDWKRVRLGAMRLAEASNLLIVPGRHVARPGEKSEAPGVELEPSEMEALILKDIPGWRKRANALHEAGVAALKAADAKDAHGIFEVGEDIEEACENCHRNYWYPNEKIPPTPSAQ